MSEAILAISLPFSFEFIYAAILIVTSGILAFIVNFYLEKKTFNDELSNYNYYLLTIGFVIIITTSIYFLKMIFKFNLSDTIIISGCIYAINIVILLIISEKHLVWMYDYSLGKKIKIDNNWNYNGNLITFTPICIILIIFAVLIYLASISIGYYNNAIEFLIASPFFIIFILLFINYFWFPVKYKFSKSKLEFAWNADRTVKYKMDDEALELIKKYNLKLPKNYKKSFLYKNPKCINLKKIYSFRLNNVNDDVLNIFVMKNGIIYTLEPLLINYLDPLSEILPMERIVQELDKEITKDQAAKPKPPKFLKEIHPIKR